MNGVSVIICCYNSEKRIPKTLQHIAAQKVDKSIRWEVILVNNASTDRTKEISQIEWDKFNSPTSLRIVNQPIPGLIAARKIGIETSKFDILVFCDDDNWLDPHYVQTAFNILNKNDNIAVCGGHNTPATDGELPVWFPDFHRSFATGEQGEGFGKAKYGVVFGAGMVIRKTALNSLVEKKHTPLLVGRKGSKLLASEDYEICYVLGFLGWDIYYSPDLKLQHFLPKHRLNWKYLRKMLNGVGYSEPELFAYHRLNSTESPLKADGLHIEWIREINQTSKLMLQHRKKLILMGFKPLTGDADVLLLERCIGRIRRLLQLRGKYDAMINHLWNTLK